MAGEGAQQPQVKHDKRKPANGRVDRYLGKLRELVHDDLLKRVVDHSYELLNIMDPINKFLLVSF